MKAAAPGASETAFTREELAGARRLNAVLNLLPRYHTGRRWNARTVQAVVRAIHFLVPDRLSRCDGAISRTIAAGDRQVGLRLTRPVGARRGLYVHFHGGAWVMGNARLDDGITRPIARDCRMLVAGIDFHNAADDRLDLALQDSKASVEWLADHLAEFEVEQIILGGESSGAHLAAEALLHLRARGKAEAVAGFVSMCGAFDLGGSRSLRLSTGRSLVIDRPSALRNLQRLTSSLSGREAKGPLFADLSGLPPALMVAGALDPILDDSISMYERWQSQNGNAECVVFPEAPHGFNRFPTKLAARANSLVRTWMSRTLDRNASAGGGR
ncbi:alpha/beta hydrolase fold domain-containing protein (plasmid) [Rhizobium bangladeshense]|uniref:alpha/beta hydrolase n=1 Tax=Rhizobium TaxID=379 RepID=UPI001105FE08|nr:MULTISPECIES: alpha/beta hydrolase fold domain-containing protein [Rhizobium]MBX4867268.1 alpha/beta hydrolase fold domain-containing protein [Rhizobium bangladeshense]MBX4891263.1 alpha/beta hydrolase fold domain-containing protein [Rhizobium bangladeshense]MBX4920573.1 alpha/beta hydrolase fold domain-containing protein [Rhizobium bangladeshense]MBX4934253.1 alpha/beta hydrolase fold domain-containing protein [Rhizobium bangladeshense]MBY3582871.1 alpha/beta hydrolase fold domain-containi